MSKPNLSNKFGKAFGSAMQVGGIMFLFFGILTIFSDADGSKIFPIIISIILILLAVLILFTTEGVLIDIENKMIMKYTKFLYIFTLGKWNSISDFHFVSLLAFNYNSSTFSRSNRELRRSEKRYEIYLLNDDHTKKILINSFLNNQDANDYIKMISGKLNVEFVKFNPPISKRTTRRR